MASTEVVMLGRHRPRRWRRAAPERLQRSRPPPRRCPAAASGCTSGRRTARRSPPPARTARCRRSDAPARNARPPARCGATCAHDRGLHRADVGEDRRRASRRGRDLRGHRAAGAHRHAEDDEIGALHRLGGSVVVALVDEAEFFSAFRRVAASAAREPTMDSASLARRAACVIDEPIRPMPISAMRSNILG